YHAAPVRSAAVDIRHRYCCSVCTGVRSFKYPSDVQIQTHGIAIFALSEVMQEGGNRPSVELFVFPLERILLVLMTSEVPAFMPGLASFYRTIWGPLRKQGL